MKKILPLLFITIVLSLSATAQTEKSTLLLGGSLSFQTTSGSTIFLANPNIGVFVAKNIAVGGQGLLTVVNSLTSWGIGPYVRGYLPGSDKGALFGQAGFSAGKSNNVSRTTLSLKAGYAAFLNKSIALEFSAGYNRELGNDYLLIGAGFQIHLKK